MTSNSFIWVLWLLLTNVSFSLSVPGPKGRDSPALQGPKVTVNGATYIGNTDANYGVDTWLGIRYAKPPTGSLRLQPPEKADNTGTLNAKNFGPQCFQLDPVPGATLSEDCLTLNIYRPSQAAMERVHKDYHSAYLPVMFWIHGGGFNDDSGEFYNPESLVNTSIELETPTIVATINYRLNFFGFSAGNEAIANNALNLGLLDQRLALQWVQENINAFGGDTEKVTIFGQSAGATSVGLQITAYDGRHEDLFRAAILESGSPQNISPIPPATWPPYQKSWDTVVAGVGCTNSSNVFKCVQMVPEQQLFNAVIAVVTAPTSSPIAHFPISWEPVVDGKFMSDFPTKLLAAGKFVKVPVIVGSTTDELTYVIPTNLDINNDTALTRLFSFVLSYAPLTTVETVLALDPLSAYPNTFGVGGTEWKRAAEIASDIFERCPGRAFIRNMTQYAPSWRYRWNAIIVSDLEMAPYLGIVHASEIAYVFGPSIKPSLNQTVDIALSRVVQKAWISFAAHLDPNALGNLSPGVSWPRYQVDTEQVLVFQKADGSARPVGQGLHTEKDPDDRPFCDFIIAKDAEFIR